MPPYWCPPGYAKASTCRQVSLVGHSDADSRKDFLAAELLLDSASGRAAAVGMASLLYADKPRTRCAKIHISGNEW